jgi:hypothetical protein
MSRRPQVARRRHTSESLEDRLEAALRRMDTRSAHGDARRAFDLCHEAAEALGFERPASSGAVAAWKASRARLLAQGGATVG